MACVGVTKSSAGNFSDRPTTSLFAEARSFQVVVNTKGGSVGPEPIKATFFPSARATGLHVTALSFSHCLRPLPSMFTSQRWRRSMSLQFELKRIVFLSGVKDH